MMPIRLFILTCLTVTVLSAQFAERTGLDDTLAVVDRHVITSRDLFERISLMPFEEKTRERDFRVIKQKAVESLVGELLLAELQREDDSTEWKAQYERRVLEHLFVRDAVYKRQVRDRVRISDDETAAGMRQYAVRKKLLVASFTNEEQGKQFVKRWRAERSKEQGRPVSVPPGPRQHDTLFISFGSADSVLERAAYGLMKRYDIAGPVRSEMFGTVVAVLLDDESNPAAAGKSFVDRHKTVTDMIRERKESQLQSEFFTQVVRKHRMEADSILFYDAASRLHQLMMRDTSERRVPAGYRYLAADITPMLYEFRPLLDSAIVRGTFGSVSLGIFLEHLYFYEYSFPSMRPRLFVPLFFQLVRTIAESEIIAQEGYERGLNFDPDVRRDAAVWERYRRSRLAEYAVAETIMNAEHRRLEEDSVYASSYEGAAAARIRAERQMERVSAVIASEALQRRVSIDYERIGRSDIPDVNMITRRTIGFGGKMNAAPMLYPQWRWVEQWNRMKEVAP